VFKMLSHIKKTVKNLLGISPLMQIKKNQQLFQIAKSTMITDSTNFDFRVSRNREKPSVIIGEDSMVGCNFIFESSEGFIKVGDRTFINGGTNLISRASIDIGNDVTIGWGCYIYDHNSHSLDWKERCKDITQQNRDYQNTGNMILNKNWDVVKKAPIKICDKVWIGFEAVILKGVTIGEGAIVGARAVVTKDVEPWTVVAGNPAKVIKRLESDKRIEEEKV